jgi:aminopeptidase
MLNKYGFDYLHFISKTGTNIKIKLVDKHIWMCSGIRANAKALVCAHNLPSEEIWTMPDCHHVNGVVVTTKPLSYNGNVIPKFTLTFKNGVVIKAVATKNQQILDNLLSIDKGSKSIGEVALVPNSSPINKTGVIFYSTLYDENSACHLALGQCYPSTIENGGKMTKTQLLHKGGNDSIQHVDFMFGSKDMKVYGYTKDNKKVMIMDNGEFVV